MRIIPVDTARLTLISTGHVNPVPVWAETADGRRTPTDQQQTDSESGELLWTVDALPADQDRAEIVGVQVRARQMPVLAKFEPVTFRDLECRISKGRDGSVKTYWSASGAEPARGNRPSPSPEPKAA